MHVLVVTDTLWPIAAAPTYTCAIAAPTYTLVSSRAAIFSGNEDRRSNGVHLQEYPFCYIKILTSLVLYRKIAIYPLNCKANFKIVKGYLRNFD